jgi:hypothetical protein
MSVPPQVTARLKQMSRPQLKLLEQLVRRKLRDGELMLSSSDLFSRVHLLEELLTNTKLSPDEIATIAIMPSEQLQQIRDSGNTRPVDGTRFDFTNDSSLLPPVSGMIVPPRFLKG